MSEIENINGFIRIDCSKLKTIIANKRDRIHKRREELKVEESKQISEKAKVEREKIKKSNMITRFFNGKELSWLKLDDFNFLKEIYIHNDSWFGDYYFDRDYGKYSPSKTCGENILNVMDELETSITHSYEEQMFVNSSTLQRIS